jgi:hypothetical protein
MLNLRFQLPHIATVWNHAYVVVRHPVILKLHLLSHPRSMCTDLMTTPVTRVFCKQLRGVHLPDPCVHVDSQIDRPPSRRPSFKTTTNECLISCPLEQTERLCRVLNTAVSYSGGPWFKPRPGDRLSWLKFSWFSSVTPGKCWDSTLN